MTEKALEARARMLIEPVGNCVIEGERFQLSGSVSRGRI
jgi:hypothetical protein